MTGKSGWFMGISGLLLLTGCASPSLSERVAKLESETAEIKRQLAAKSPESVTLEDLFSTYTHAYYNGVSPTLVKRYLDTVELPQNPTPAQVDAYLVKLASVSRYNNDDSMQIFFVGKLTAIGEANLSKLVPLLDNNQAYYRAFVQLGGGERKDLMVQALKQNRNNTSLVALYGESVDPSDAGQVLAMLDRHPGLIAAVKKLKLEKQALPILREKLLETTGSNSFNYEVEWLKTALDAMDPPAAVAFTEQYWKKMDLATSRYENWGIIQRALVLASRGYLPAFQYLGDNSAYFQNREFFQKTASLADCRPEEFAVWYAKNRNQLVLNPATGRYQVSAPAAK